MNKLSWLLYLGNISENFGLVLVVFGAVALILTIVLFIIYLNHSSEINSAKKWGTTIPEYNDKTSHIVFCALSAIFFWLIAAIFPSSNTVYAIAASEVGEQAMKTPLAEKAEKGLESWIDKQIKNNTMDDKKNDQ